MAFADKLPELPELPEILERLEREALDRGHDIAEGFVSSDVLGIEYQRMECRSCHQAAYVDPRKGGILPMHERRCGESALNLDAICLSFNDEIGRGLKTAYEKEGEPGAMRFLSALSSKELQEYEIKMIIEMGWQMGLKGLTVYRDGCREEQPMRKGKRRDAM